MMTILLPLVVAGVLAVLPALGAHVTAGRWFFGVLFPYFALVVFLAGVTLRVLKWAKAPVPFRIPTTCGQQQSLSWIKSSRLDNPHDTVGTIGRMALEVLFFRSLFRNTRVELQAGPRLGYGSAKWLWAGGLAFHYSFLVIILRHLRYFTEPIPRFVGWVQSLDGFLEVGVPPVMITSVVLVGAVGFLFLRRVWSPQLRYLSLPADYFPLFLILAIGASGLLLRHVVRTDIVGVKTHMLGVLSFHPALVDGLHGLFYTHLFLVCALFAYFPFSKLMHLAGVFLSPTRNLANNNRRVRHVNPWNYPVTVHTYEEYEDEFRDKMKAAGIPVEKE